MKLASGLCPSKRSLEHVQRTIDGFLAQTYPCKELIILRTDDDYSGLTLRPGDRDVYWHHVPPGLSIGELRNVAARLARGSVLFHVDDDDTSHPERLARSMAAIDAGASLVGSSRVIFEGKGKRWLFDGAALTPKYLVGGTLVYRRELWERQNFLDVQQGEDSKWQWWHWKKIRAHNPYGTGAWVDLADEAMYQAKISPDATSPKDVESPGWSAIE